MPSDSAFRAVLWKKLETNISFSPETDDCISLLPAVVVTVSLCNTHESAQRFMKLGATLTTPLIKVRRLGRTSARTWTNSRSKCQPNCRGKLLATVALRPRKREMPLTEHQICWRFQSPCLNNMTLATAIAPSAITVPMNTPFERSPTG